jgi:hypothetical protein
MSDAIVLSRLRHFLLGLAAFICAGTIVELALTQHWENGVQILPFVLCGISFIVIMMALLRPQHRWVRLLRWVMAVTLVGSLFGVYEHIEHNIAFALEIRPTAVVSDIFLEALGGANPLLAPGILAFTALLALAATYYHPVFHREIGKY